MRLLGTSTAWWTARSDVIAQEIRKREQGATAALWPLDSCSPSKYPQGEILAVGHRRGPSTTHSCLGRGALPRRREHRRCLGRRILVQAATGCPPQACQRV